MTLQPDTIFADQAFQHALNTGRRVMRLTTHPQAPNNLGRQPRSTGLARTTGFSSKPPKGKVPAYAARYRGVDIDINRNMTDGSPRPPPTEPSGRRPG